MASPSVPIQPPLKAMSAPDVAPASTAPPTNRRQLTGPALLTARVVWVLVALLTLGLFILAVPQRFVQLQTVCAGAACQEPQLGIEDVRVLQGLGLSRSANALYSLGIEIVLAFFFFAVAVLIFARKSNDRVALLVSLMLITFGPATFTGTLRALSMASTGWQLPMQLVSSFGGSPPEWLVRPPEPWRLPVGLVVAMGQVSFAFFFFLFADGRFAPRWGYLPVVVWVVWQVPAAFFPASIFNAANWPQILSVVAWLGFLTCFVYAQIFRYRHMSDTIQRQQTKWVVFGVTGALGGFLTVVVLAFAVGALGISNVLVRQAVSTGIYASMLLLPLSFAFAILRSRLWEIDLIINRALVYVSLTAILAGIFAAMITFSQKLFVSMTGQESDVATILTTVVVVALFTPVKEKLQSLADKRFKEPPEAYKRLGEFAHQVQTRLSTAEPVHMCHRLLEEAVTAFGAEGGALFFERIGGSSPAYTVADWHEKASVSVPIKTKQLSLGRIVLGEQRDGGEYTSKDIEILQQTASAVALAVQQDAGLEMAVAS